ncbi:MAG: hypothetical protein IJ806_00550 [Ruminococcus sp.]|nr:hypothetical protein [Ruminococcus sp.]
MKSERAVIVLFSAAVLLTSAAGLYAAAVREGPAPRYQVRQDLSIHFNNADAVIDRVRECLKARQELIRITYTSHSSNLEDLDELVRELMEFACCETGAADEGDYLRCQIGGYDAGFTQEERDGLFTYELNIRPIYFTDAEQEEEVSRAVEKVIASLGLPEGAGEEEKIRAVYDCVCSNVSYDWVHRRSENYRLRSAAYGALIYGRATCLGYAVTVYRLLRELGVGCRVVTGDAVDAETGEREYHAWVIIRLDGKWYNADPTWDSRSGTHSFFLKSDEDFGDHIRKTGSPAGYGAEDYPMATESYGKGK